LFLNAAGKQFSGRCSEGVRPEIHDVGAYFCHTQELTVRAFLNSDPPSGRLDPPLRKARPTLFAFLELRAFAAGMVFFI